jgi:glucokinase
MPALLKEVNGTYTDYSGREHRRLVQTVFNLQDAEQKERFLKGDTREIAVPRSTRRICFDSLSRSGVGISQLGTSEAAAIGAYAMALQHLAP